MDAALIIFIVLFFTFGVPLLFLVFFFERIHKPLEQAKLATPKEIIVKEVVMVPCVYCGDLMPNTASFCPACGAPRKK